MHTMTVLAMATAVVMLTASPLRAAEAVAASPSVEQTLQDYVTQQRPSLPKRITSFEMLDDISIQGHTLTHLYTETIKADAKTMRLFAGSKRQELVKLVCNNSWTVAAMSGGATIRYVYRTAGAAGNDGQVIADIALQLSDCA